MMVFKQDQHQWFINFLIKKIILIFDKKYQLADELHKPIIKKVLKKKFIHF